MPTLFSSYSYLKSNNLTVSRILKSAFEVI